MDEIRTFLDVPLAYAEEGRVSRLLSGHKLSEFAKAPEALERLNRYAVSAWGLASCAAEDFPAGALGGLLLLEGARIRRLAEFVGCLVAGRKLRALVEGSAMKGLAEGLPGVYPGCLRLRARFPEWCAALEDLSEDALPPLEAEALRLAGLQLLAAALQQLPDGLQQRWLLHLSAEEARLCRPSAGIPRPGESDLERLLTLVYEDAAV